MTLFDEFSQTCARFPDHVAYEGRGMRVRYAEMLADVLSAAESHEFLGVLRGDRIAVSSGPCYPVFTLELACSRKGATLAFLESYMAPNSAEWEEAIEGSSAHWAVTWSAEGKACWVRTPAPRDDGAPLARPILLQARTSGTTGRSKGVCLSEAALLQAVRNTQEVARCHAGSRGMLLYEPLGLLSQIAAFSTLLAGAAVVDGLALAAAPEGIGEFIEAHRISHLVMVPQHIGALLSDPHLSQRKLDCLEVVMYGAAPVTRELMRRAQDAIGCRWLQCYGMTETTGPVCWLAAEEQSLAGFSVGRAAPGCAIRIADMDGGETLPSGASGEVQVSGALLMEGYWDTGLKQAVPGDKLVDGWFRTGDLGYVTEAGHLILQGRATDEIVCALGYTIKPGEIEAVLQGVPDVVDAAAIGFEIGDVGVTPIAVCHVRGDEDAMRERIRDAIHSNLDASKRPTHLVLARHPLPRGANGKVHKARLKSQTVAGDLVAL